MAGTLTRWVAVWVVVGTGLIALTVMSVPAPPANDARLRRFNLPPVGPEHVFRQSFVMDRDRLNGIDLAIEPAVPNQAADIQMELFDTTDPGNARAVRGGVVHVGSLGTTRTCRFEFSPIVDSRFRHYQLEIAATADTGVALVATHGDNYADGALGVDGKTRSADLVFRTSADAAAPSVGAQLWGVNAASHIRGTIVLALLALQFVVAGVLIATVRVVSPRQS